LLFARRGYRVLLLDRDRFPSETMSTRYIHQPGIERLSRWGLLDAVIASACPRLDRIRYQLADVVLEGRIPAWAGSDATYAPRRYVLDQILVDAAVEAGADFADGCTATELLSDGSRVTGLRFRNRSGNSVDETARLLVGADGMRSTIARLVSAREQVGDPLMTCVYYSCWRDVPAIFGFTEVTGNWLAVIPTHDDTTILATYFPQDRFDEIRTHAWEAHVDAIRAISPHFAESIAGRSPIDRLRGSGDQRNFFRQAAGAGWALVGDAGHHEDSITARGITNSFVQADLLTECVADDLLDEERLVQALDRYAVERDAALTEAYRSTLALARLQVDESRIAILRAVSTDPELTQRFFRVVAGIMPMNELVTPELLAILASLENRPRPRRAPADRQGIWG
jgi:2-polyprenyl-6-methoxyphenol hydroxylase-like FAD-dependent oxidoreductase